MNDADYYTFLIDRAKSRAKHGREAIFQAEGNFHQALYKLRAHFPPGIFRDLEEQWLALSEYPAVLRSVLDAQDEANELLSQARNMKWIERMSQEAESREAEKKEAK